MKHLHRALLLASALSGLVPAVAHADPAACATVRVGQPPWGDIAVTNALTDTVLNAIGYNTQPQTLAVPVIYQGLKDGQVDLFQGNWMPAQSALRAKYQGGYEVLTTNLTGAKFTLAVPDYVAATGVHSVADLGKFSARFGGKIYGIEPGAPANKNISAIIGDSSYGLGGWQLVASSEAGMLSQVQRAEAAHQWIVFLAWEPHPMNVRFHITYLNGGDKYFGPDYGAAAVYTLGRPGLATQCPNLARFISQVRFDVDTENALLAPVAEGKAEVEPEARAYLASHPALLASWLTGVTTLDGKPALPAAEAALKAD